MSGRRLGLLAATLTLSALGASCGGDGEPDPPPCVSAPQRISWSLVTPAAAWSPRDSAAEYAFGGRLWIMGGWEDSFAPNPRDIWSSTDGKDWSLVRETAPWIHGDLAAPSVFADRMWLLGGWANGRLAGASSTNEVWSSGNGVDWQSHGSAPWDARLGAASVAFAGRLWLTGGVTRYYDGTADSLRNDVWSTADGVSWQRATSHAAWIPRAYHQLVAHEGRLFVLGGGNYLPAYMGRNDVWSSSDGVHWHQETDAAPWSPRIWFSAVSYRGYLWVLGGWSGDPYRNWADVWYSRDGRHWALYEASEQWSRRHEHSAVVHDDQLWVAGGFAEPVNHDVWTLSLPPGWVGSCAAQAASERGSEHE